MITTMKLIDGFRNPQQFGLNLKTYAGFPLEFFQKVTVELKDRLRWYKSTVEVRGSARFAQETVRT